MTTTPSTTMTSYASKTYEGGACEGGGGVVCVSVHASVF